MCSVYRRLKLPAVLLWENRGCRTAVQHWWCFLHIADHNCASSLVSWTFPFVFPRGKRACLYFKSHSTQKCYSVCLPMKPLSTVFTSHTPSHSSYILLTLNIWIPFIMTDQTIHSHTKSVRFHNKYSLKCLRRQMFS